MGLIITLKLRELFIESIEALTEFKNFLLLITWPHKVIDVGLLGAVELVKDS